MLIVYISGQNAADYVQAVQEVVLQKYTCVSVLAAPHHLPKTRYYPCSSCLLENGTPLWERLYVLRVAVNWPYIESSAGRPVDQITFPPDADPYAIAEQVRAKIKKWKDPPVISEPRTVVHISW